MSGLATACLAGLFLLASALSLFAVDTLPEDCLLYVSFNSNSIGDSGPQIRQPRCQFFKGLSRYGKAEGRPLSKETFEVSEILTFGALESEVNWKNASKVLLTGATDQAVAFPGEKNIDPARGAITFWFRGKGWDASTDSKDIFVTLEGPGGTLSILKEKPRILSVVSSLSPAVRLDAPLPQDLNRFHLVAFNYDGKAAELLIDGEPLARAKGFILPQKISRIVVGQLGPGAKSDRIIDDFSIYSRPLKLSEVNRLYVREGKLMFRRLAAIVKTSKPIKIDGIMEKDEWKDAAEITALLKIDRVSLYNFWGPADLASDQSSFYITYDDNYIYIAHHSPPPANIRGQENLIAAMLKSAVTRHDASVDQDDSLRISVIDPFPNGDEYKFYVNSINTTYDFTSSDRAPGSKLNGINLGWDPKWKVNSTLTMDGWVFECAIPFADLKVRKPGPGSTLHMNFCRLWRQVKNEDDVWCFGERTYDEQIRTSLPAGEIVFQGEEGVVVKLHDVGKVQRGRLEISADILNRSSSPKRIEVFLDSNSGEISHRERLDIDPGEGLPFKFSSGIKDFRTHEVSFSVADAETGQPYHITSIPVLRKDKPEIYLRKYRSAELLKFETNMEFMSAHPLEKISVKMEIKNESTGKNVFSKTFKRLRGYTPVFEVSTRGWPIGKYLAKFSFRSGWKKISETSVVYNRVALPEWWNNEIGKELGVPYPWTPLKVSGQSVRCWGREYRFGKSLYPEQILTQGRKILRSPMRILLETKEGKKISTDALEAKSRWTARSELRIEGERVIEGEDLALMNSFWSEYDGIIWSRLVLVPKKKITISSIFLEIPFSPEFTDVINTYDYSLRGTGKLKPEGFTGALRPIWLGNGVGGLQWFAETTGPFFVSDERRVLQVSVAPEGATLRVVMIDVPTEFDSEHSIEFGFIATPTRKKIRRTFEDPLFHRITGGPGPWYPPGQEFMPAPDWGTPPSGWRSYGRAPRGPGILSGQNIYITTGTINTGTEDFKNFGDEWLREATERPGKTVAVTHASKSYRDWFVWRHWKYFQEHPFQSLYYDCAIENASANLYAGAGYIRRDGSVAVTAPILGARDIVKRLYNMIIKYYPFAWIGMHDSGMINMAYSSFATVYWDGENFNSIINEKRRTYRGVLDPAMFRAEYMGHNFGCPTMFLGQGRIRDRWADEIGPDKIVDYLHGLCLLHDVDAVGWIFSSPAREKVVERTIRALRQHRLYSPSYQFVPYWEQHFVEKPFEEFYASFYIRKPVQFQFSRFWMVYDPFDTDPKPKKVVAIFFNNSDYNGILRLKLDWKALGFDSPDGLKVENAVHSTGFKVENPGTKNEKGVFFPKPDEFARIEDGKLVFPIMEWNYRMIVLEEPGSRE